MQKLRIIALTEDRKALLEKLQRLGTLQPEYIPEDEDDILMGKVVPDYLPEENQGAAWEELEVTE